MPSSPPTRSSGRPCRIAALVNECGYINADFNDMNTIMALPGKSMIGMGMTFRFGGAFAAPISTSFRPVTAEVLAARISGRQGRSIAVRDGKPRLSIARGGQEERPVLIMPDGRMGFGEGDLGFTQHPGIR
jgi:hypothetical protein